MSIQIAGSSGTVAEVAGTGFRAFNTHVKPIEYGVGGHYRTTARVALVANQAANSRLFEVRNSHASLLVIPTRVNVRWLQTAAHTAAIEDSLDFFRVTSFTAVDTTNVVTPAASVKRASMAASSAAVIRHVTAAGAAAGMTGGTLTKDSSPFSQFPKWLLAALPTTDVPFSFLDALDDVNGSHPFVFTQNEGFIIENRVLLGAAAGSSLYIDFTWAEVAAF